MGPCNVLGQGILVWKWKKLKKVRILERNGDIKRLEVPILAKERLWWDKQREAKRRQS